MNTIKLGIFKFLLKKYMLGYMIKGWTSLKGHKTQIFALICIGVFAGQVTGYIPPDLAKQLYAIFGSGSAFSFLQKLQRYQSVIEQGVSLVKEEVKKK